MKVKNTVVSSQLYASTAMNIRKTTNRVVQVPPQVLLNIEKSSISTLTGALIHINKTLETAHKTAMANYDKMPKLDYWEKTAIEPKGIIQRIVNLFISEKYKKTAKKIRPTTAS